jgi:hypothetical protein
MENFGELPKRKTSATNASPVDHRYRGLEFNSGDGCEQAIKEDQHLAV